MEMERPPRRNSRKVLQERSDLGDRPKRLLLQLDLHASRSKRELEALGRRNQIDDDTVLIAHRAYATAPADRGTRGR